MKYFGGIEGGATRSKCMIIDENGLICALVDGPSTNHWQVGIPEVTKRVADMVNRAKIEANILQSIRLASLGLSLSGCEEEKSNSELENLIRNTYPDLSENYVVCADTMCGIFTVSPLGGIVAIAGTGSNTLLKNPDGTTYSCGGFGHVISDEGSAFYIAHRAIKIVFDDMDGFRKCQYPTQRVWKSIQQHFNIKTKQDMLPHLYANFNKSFYSGLCKKLAKLAENDCDPLALCIFDEAGSCLATNIVALIPHVHKDLVQSENLNVLCVGSVWCSWPLLQNGFLKVFKDSYIPFNVTLIRLRKDAALGACYMAANAISHKLICHYPDNYTILYEYNKER